MEIARAINVLHSGMNEDRRVMARGSFGFGKSTQAAKPQSGRKHAAAVEVGVLANTQCDHTDTFIASQFNAHLVGSYEAERLV
jgi:hypothetical protein